MKAKLLSLLCAVALLGCGEGGQEHPASPMVASPATPNVQQVRKGGLEIKGVRLGMDIREVPNAMMAILAERQLADFGFTDVIRASDGVQCVLMYTKGFLRAIESRARERYGEARAPGKVDGELLTSCVNSDGVMSVKAGADGSVFRVEFNDVKDVFDARGMPPAEFAGKVSAEHHLPEMKPNEAKTAWIAVGPDGTRVEVDAKEVLGIPMVRLYMSWVAP